MNGVSKCQKYFPLKLSMKLYQCPKIKIKTFGKLFLAFSSDITHFWDGVLLMNMTLNHFRNKKTDNYFI